MSLCTCSVNTYSYACVSTHWVLSSSSATTAETKGTKRLWWSSSRTMGNTASYRSLQMSPKMCAADADMGWKGGKNAPLCTFFSRVACHILIPESLSYLHIWGFEQQVAEWCVVDRWQNCVFYVGQLQAQWSQIIRLRLAAVPFWLEKIPARSQEHYCLVTELWRQQILFTAIINCEEMKPSLNIHKIGPNIQTNHL